jgi:hypothetical protein
LTNFANLSIDSFAARSTIAVETEDELLLESNLISGFADKISDSRLTDLETDESNETRGLCFLKIKKSQIMKRMIKLVALLEGRGMKTMKSFLIAMGVLGTVIFATINVALNKNAPIASNLTLQNLEAFTNESGTECPPPYNGSELLNGCKDNEAVTNIDNSGNGTITFSCSPGQNITCTYGVFQVTNYVILSGQVLSVFTCRSVIVI